MKNLKLFLASITILLFVSSCTNDEASSPINPISTGGNEEGIILNEVAYLSNKVELFNPSSSAIDVTNYYLCLGADTNCKKIGDLTIITGDLFIQPNTYLVVEYNISTVSGGLGLYGDTINSEDPSNPTGFDNAENIIGFVQWGAGGTDKESIAVTAGLWNAGDFLIVANDTNRTLSYLGSGSGKNSWIETETDSFGNENSTEIAPRATVVLNEVEYFNNRVELFNPTDAAIDISEYFLCLGPGTYQKIETLTSASTSINPNEFLVVNYNMPVMTGGLGLYKNNNDFTLAENLIDFVQWGKGGSSRENVAVSAGLWAAGDFISVTDDATKTISYSGSGFGVNSWSETDTPTIGAEN